MPRRWLLLPVLTLLLTGAAAAGDRTAAIRAGLSGLDFRYEEFDDQGDRLDRERGWLPGATLGFSYRADAWLFDGDLRWSAGAADYTSPAADTTTDEQLLDLTLLLGTPLLTRGDDRLFLIAGGGYRSWWRDIRSTASANGLDETYRWHYALVGLRGEHRLDAATRLTAEIHLRRALNPELSVHFRNNYDNVDLALGGKTGYRIGVAWLREMRQGITLRISPWYEQWKLGRSTDAVLYSNGTAVGSVFEPRSETRDFGLDLSLSWPFALN